MLILHLAQIDLKTGYRFRQASSSAIRRGQARAVWRVTPHQGFGPPGKGPFPIDLSERSPVIVPFGKLILARRCCAQLLLFPHLSGLESKRLGRCACHLLKQGPYLGGEEPAVKE